MNFFDRFHISIFIGSPKPRKWPYELGGLCKLVPVCLKIGSRRRQATAGSIREAKGGFCDKRMLSGLLIYWGCFSSLKRLRWPQRWPQITFKAPFFLFRRRQQSDKKKHSQLGQQLPMRFPIPGFFEAIKLVNSQRSARDSLLDTIVFLTQISISTKQSYLAKIPNQFLGIYQIF